MEFWSWLGKNKDQLALLIAVVPIAWAAIQYLWAKKQEIKHRQFETYHGLIKSLVQREDPSQPMMLDRQIAIIFELRNYKSYFPVSLRILKGLKESWTEYGPEEKRSRLQAELDESIKYIERKI
ncbi:hypothetical protein [Microbulbifer rhizosphaerae]|uniref:Uncharacterized protein n=1 Tax=Microbulbifer rhizosphaerae TaxID=1562603 RepID=A0A7W4WGK4_9GAMM|nr:hypothetical protein [Microbulbifer rhizosphaerae]MBB3063293.1 hypothetical protein [Microbulbifer rhizosphaerae]